MTFLNAVLLFGLAAAAIPIIIHIINRSRFRTVQWGAMHLLEQVLRTRRRRIQLEQMILLAIRTAIPLFLVLCLARPVIKGASGLLGQNKTSLFVLVDDSASMGVAVGSSTRFVEATTAARQIVESLPRASETNIVWMSQNGSTDLGPSYDLTRMAGLLTSAEGGAGVADPVAALSRVLSRLGNAQYPDRQALVLSDFQKVSWPESAKSARADMIEAMRKLDLPCNVSLLRIGGQGADNIAVDALEVSQSVLAVGQKARIRASVRNYGTGQPQDLRVYFRVDGEERGVSQVRIGPKETGQALFQYAFDKAGSHVVEVQVDADSLKADNVRRCSVEVWEHLPVLIVSGDIRPEPLKSESAFLEIALQPFAMLGGKKGNDLVKATVMSPDQVKPEDIDATRVIILANVGQLPDRLRDLVARFVEEGGGLLVFPGDRVDANWYNNQFFNTLGLLPCSFQPIVDRSEKGAVAAAIVSQNFQHPALSLFNDPRNGTLGDAEIRKWYPLHPPETGADKVWVFARLDSGDPFLAEKTFGAGRVIQSAVPCDADWSNLPMRPSYLPLMQQLVIYLASTVHPPRNLFVGQRLAAIVPSNRAGKVATVSDAEGKKHDVTIQNKGRFGLVEYDRTEHPGTYTLDIPGGEKIYYAVNTPPEESDLTPLDDDSLQAMGKELGVQVATSVSEYLDQDKQRRFGREIWQQLLWLVAALMILEVYLEHRFASTKA